jgi:hypothetical protein
MRIGKKKSRSGRGKRKWEKEKEVREIRKEGKRAM